MLSPQNHFMCSQPAGKNMDYIQAVGSPEGSSTAINDVSNECYIYIDREASGRADKPSSQ